MRNQEPARFNALDIEAATHEFRDNALKALVASYVEGFNISTGVTDISAVGLYTEDRNR